jgi:ubiquinone/menaquinone biosynthesis C-methylase UbiE
MLNTTCPNCEEGTPRVFYQTDQVPTNSCILLETEEEAINYPVGEIALGYCDRCGFVYNTKMDISLTEYSERYEETQGFSGVFSKFHRQLAEDCINKYGLHSKKVVEIGCGKGEFLMLLCEDGKNEGIGYDPSYIPARNEKHNSENVTFITDFYSEQYRDPDADFVCCKMTLEHIPETNRFIRMVRRSLENDRATIFFMIPESRRIMETVAFEDIYYEHCSYFSDVSLAYLFADNGFQPKDIYTLYDDQYLAISATVSDHVELPDYSTTLKEMTGLVDSFNDRFQAQKKYWKDAVAKRIAEGKKIVIWGSGSKGVSFLTTLCLQDEISYAVDINPNREGYFMPMTAHEIVSPEFLIDFKPDTVILMNRIYHEEVRDKLNDLGLNPEILLK